MKSELGHNNNIGMQESSRVENFGGCRNNKKKKRKLAAMVCASKNEIGKVTFDF